MVECTPINIFQIFCWSMTPFIIGLPYDHHIIYPSGSRQVLPIKTLVAKQQLMNNKVKYIPGEV